MDKKVFSLCLRSIVYQEDGVFHARCLEMDLLGVGPTEKEALSELTRLIEAQISFAVFKKDDGLLLFPAEKEYFERWEKANRAKLHHELFPDKKTSDLAIQMNGRSVVISFDKSDLDKLKKQHRFDSVRDPVLA
jgi:hypothetical protein